MKRIGRWMGVVLAGALFLSACVGKQQPSSQAEEKTGENRESLQAETELQEPEVKLTVAFLSWTADPPDLGKVEDALNEILKERIHATVDLMPINGGDYQQRMNLMLQNGDELDLLVTGTGLNYYMQAMTGQLKPLDDLLDEYGSGIKDALGEYLHAAMIPGGSVCAVPVLQSYASATTFVMRQDLLDETGITADEIQTLDDLEKVFAGVKEKHPDMAPVVPESPGGGIFGLGLDVLYDPLGNSLGVLPGYGQTATVADLFETPEYEAWVYRLRDWYLNGYILADAATNNETAADLLAAGRGFGHFTGVAVGAADTASAAYGMPMAAVTFGEPFVSAGNVTTIAWGIAAQSKHPEKAMEFLNLLYTDAGIVNLIDYGIEGVHYVKLSDNVIGYPEGMDPAAHPYNFNLSWEFGNVFLSYVPAGTDPEIWNKSKEMNEKALKSLAMGFVPDVTPISNEIASVTNVAGQYMTILGTGAVDPDEYLPQFIQKLKDAGMDVIVAEKQAQLDRWLKENQ
jgi:putative aldouronate transport system substrate-binding protein